MLRIMLICILAATCFSKDLLKHNSKIYMKSHPLTQATAAVESEEVPNKQCTSRSAGWKTSNNQVLEAVIAEGQKSGSLDVTTKGLGCSHVGLMATACDSDSSPLVVISTGLSIIDVYRNGNSTDEINVTVKLQCKELVSAWASTEDQTVADVNSMRFDSK